jgi:hypothetical protein
MFALSLLATDKSVDNVSRYRHCRPLGVVGDAFFFRFVFVAVTDIWDYESNCWFVVFVEKEGVLPLQTYVCLNQGP